MFRNKFPIQDFLIPFANEALARLSYLYPDVEFELIDSSVAVKSDSKLDEVLLREEIKYALYRTKIWKGGADNRSALFSALFR